MVRPHSCKNGWRSNNCYEMFGIYAVAFAVYVISKIWSLTMYENIWTYIKCVSSRQFLSCTMWNLQTICYLNFTLQLGIESLCHGAKIDGKMWVNGETVAWGILKLCLTYHCTMQYADYPNMYIEWVMYIIYIIYIGGVAFFKLIGPWEI